MYHGKYVTTVMQTEDNNSRKCVTGYIVLIYGIVIVWRLVSHKTVTLHFIEVKYSAIMEVCYKILFVCEILLFMGVVFECTINVRVDNIGDILLSDNTPESQQKNHIEVSHHLICDCVEDGTLKTRLLSLGENLADKFIKNLSNGPFESLTWRYVYLE